MNSCSLGLVCDFDNCPNLESCESITAPWGLPYEYHEPTDRMPYCLLRVNFEWQLDYLHDEGQRIFDEDRWDAKEKLEAIDREFHRCSVIVSELKKAGWADPVPIHFHNEV